MEIVRKSISFPVELADKIAKRAKEQNRSFSAQVAFEMAAMTDMLKKDFVAFESQESRVEEEE